METNSVSMLQKIIDVRAEKRLEKDLDVISKCLIDNWNLLEHTYIKVSKPNDQEIRALYFTSIFRAWREQFKKDNIERYIEAETNMFVREIDELKEKVANLENITQDE